jgi:hypothetical protein
MATQYNISTGSIALVANTAKVVIEVPTGSVAPYQVVAVEMGFTATLAGSVLVEWGTYTTTGTGTTVTPEKYGQDQGPSAILGTVKVNDTAAPAGFARGTLPAWRVPLPGGLYSVLFPYNREMYVPVSTNLALRLNSTRACNVHVTLTIEQ